LQPEIQTSNFIYNYLHMKTTLNSIIIFALIALSSCGNAGNSTSDNGKTADSKSADAPHYLTQEEFAQKVFDYKTNKEWNYLGDIPCVIDFYADWCRPCKMVAPIMEDLAKDYAGKVHFYKVNTDKEKELAMAFNIQSIPAILFVPAKGQPQMSVGAMSKEEYAKTINDFMLKPTK
jgi:thioredoxin